MKSLSYHDEQNKKNAIKLREILNSLPLFCFEFFRGLEPTTSIRTRIAYAYDLKIFFNFLQNYYEVFKDEDINALDVKMLDKVEPENIEMFLDYLSYYISEDSNNKDIKHQNGENGKARKLATIRTLYSYFFKKKKIKSNPAVLVDLPKIHEKTIVRLEVDEVARLLDEVENGKNLTKTQQRYHKYTKNRDIALISVLLGTGIRVSECVGLDIHDLDFNVNGMKITRKGGNEVILYFGEEVEQALHNYLVERKKIQTKVGHEEALFLSMQHRRLSVRAVQNIVKKYSQIVTTLKNISPHKLRSTYGTNLYRETGDIYLVADVLGHKDVNTTRKHYAQIEDYRRRQAAKIIKLRKL